MTENYHFFVTRIHSISHLYEPINKYDVKLKNRSKEERKDKELFIEGK